MALSFVNWVEGSFTGLKIWLRGSWSTGVLQLHNPAPAMTAESLAKALGGRKVGGGWMARCPAHDDRKPSLSICEIADGKVLVHCHARCAQEQVIDALRSRGLWPEKGSHVQALRSPRRCHDPARS